MKRAILLVAALCLWCGAQAQDIIRKSDATEVTAKVLEINKSEVRYKRFSNLEGPTYILPIAEINYIIYQNGEREEFSKPAPQPVTSQPSQQSAPQPSTLPMQPLQPSQPSQQAPPSQPQASTPQVKEVVRTVYVRQDEGRQYSIGDLYDENGVRGVVCALSDDHQHGLVLSLDELYLAWTPVKDAYVVGATSNADGAENMVIVEKFIADNKLTWDAFPAFKWCRDKGEGWYLPAIDEVLAMGNNFNGGNRINYNRAARNRFNDALKNNGGERIERLGIYFSSTEIDKRNAHCSHTSLEPPYVYSYPKHNKFLVRAVHKF